MHATEIVAYTYAAENWTPAGLIEVGIREGWLTPAARDMAPEDVLDQAQHSFGIDRVDEYSFDSDEFPKVIFASQIEDDELFRNERGEYAHIS